MWQILVKKPIEHKSVEYKSFKYFSLSKAKTGELKYSYKNVSTTFAIAANVQGFLQCWYSVLLLPGAVAD